MNIKNLFAPVAKAANNAGAFGKKNLPTILTCVGCVGFVATVYEASKATPGYMRVREEYERRKNEDHEEIKFSEKAIDAVDAYWKAAVLGVASMGCFVMANKINLERIAALAAGYSMLDKKHKEYVNKAKEVFGENEKKIPETIAKEQISLINTANMGNRIINTGHGMTLIKDSNTGQLFYSDINYIRAAVNALNENMLKSVKSAPFADDHVCITDAEFYTAINLPMDSSMWDNLGVEYSRDGLFTVDLETTSLTEDKVPCILMQISTNPIGDWEEVSYRPF